MPVVRQTRKISLFVMNTPVVDQFFPIIRVGEFFEKKLVSRRSFRFVRDLISLSSSSHAESVFAFFCYLCRENRKSKCI